MTGERAVEKEVPKGLALNKHFKRGEFNKDQTVTTPDGRKISVFRFIDKERAFISMDEKKKDDANFRALIRQNKTKRILDAEAITGSLQGGPKKKNLDSDGKKGQKVNSEIEKLLIEKHSVK